MYTINVRNVNHALPAALAALRDRGQRVAPRGMPTLELEGPVATTYTQPAEMVLFDRDRDANPFFHFFEALWVLRGRQDVAFLSWFLPRMADYSDDGVSYHAPYGYRLRTAFGFDQIETVLKVFEEDETSRQGVLAIWHPNLDFSRTKDKPCNDMIMLKIRDGKLRMTVCNRSNDVVWGAYGANVVQFSTLLRYMAGRLGIEVGEYTQVSDSFHVYEDNPFWLQWREKHGSGRPPVIDPYSHADGGGFDHKVLTDALLNSVHGGPKQEAAFMGRTEVLTGAFDEDLVQFFDLWDEGFAKLCATGEPSSALMNERNYKTVSFAYVALPLLQTLCNWRAKKPAVALETVKQTTALDWRMAAELWMIRRLEKQGKEAA